MATKRRKRTTKKTRSIRKAKRPVKSRKTGSAAGGKAIRKTKKSKRTVKKSTPQVSKSFFIAKSVAPTTPIVPLRIKTTPFVSLLINKTTTAALRAILEAPVPVPLYPVAGETTPQPAPPAPEPVPPSAPSLSLGERSPSAHVIDLRSHALPRERVTTKPSIGGYTPPRTISERGGQKFIWGELAVVSLVKFIGYLTWMSIVGIGKVLALPLTIGLKFVDRNIDLDRLLLPTSETAKKIPDLNNQIPSNNQQPPPKAEITQAVTPVRTPKPWVTPTPVRVGPFTVHAHWRRALLSFAGLSLAAILPVQLMNSYRTLNDAKSSAVTAGKTGADALRSALSGGVPDVAALEAAASTFSEARASVESIGETANAILERLPGVGGEFRSGKALLKAGENLANAAALLAQGFATLDLKDATLTDKLARIETIASHAEPALLTAVQAINEVQDLPPELDVNTFNTLRSSVISLETTVHGFLDLAPSMRSLLGENEQRRFLVLFQNNAELRPTGGFIGSFALIDVDRGRIKKIEVPEGGSYDLQGSLRAHVLAPDPLRLVNAKWEFQDGNWFPDFPTTAQKMMWFYAQSAGPSVDGVISLNAPVLADLIDVVGPVGMPEYGVTATGTTVLKTAQEIVESDAARASGKPKKFIADLLPRVLDKVMTGDKETTLRAVAVFAKALEWKDVMFYFTDPAAETAFGAHGWTGHIPSLPPTFDSIGLVRTNIAGGKTDGVIQTHIDHHATVASNGMVTDQVTVTLTHTGMKGEPFTGVRNVTYLRLYVPNGSRLLSATGDFRPPDATLFDTPPEGYGPDETLAQTTGVLLHDPNSGTAVNNEFGRTVFGNWTQTDPGQTSTTTFTYVLPFIMQPISNEPNLLERIGLTAHKSAMAHFGLSIMSQPGARATELTSTLTLPEGWYPTAASPEGIATDDGWSTTMNIETDRAIGTLISTGN